MFQKISKILGFQKASDRNFKSHSILIVDDNPGDALLVERTIERMGHHVLKAENGKIGFELAKSEKPDLILSDCRMPEMDGVEMFKRIKGDPETKDIPIVFLTGDETPTTMVGCFDMGADNYMCKPINPKLVADQIKIIFHEHFGD